MNTPLVSVVMSVFNGERFLREAIDSILAQSFRDFEFIIIDDGSKDQSGAIIDHYQTCDPRVRVIHQDNAGVAESVNRACGQARGVYIARMDADDIAVSDRFKWQLAFMEAHPEVAVLGGTVECIDQEGKTLRIAPQPLDHCGIQLRHLDRCAIWQPTTMIRKTAWDAVGGYRNVGEAEDYDLWLRIEERFQLANLEPVLLKYRHHPGQVSVYRCKTQALSWAVALASAQARRRGNPDPLDSVGEITPTVIARLAVRLGVNPASQQTTFVRTYLASIRNMYEIGQHTLVLKALDETSVSLEFKDAEPWSIADLQLFAANVYWRERRFASSILSMVRAIVTRPVILGRPLKPLLSRFRLAETP